MFYLLYSCCTQSTRDASMPWTFIIWLILPHILFCLPRNILSGIPRPAKAPTLRTSPQNRGTRSLPSAWTTTFPRLTSPRSMSSMPTRSELGSVRLAKLSLRLTRNPFTLQTGRIRLEGGLQGRNSFHIFVFLAKSSLLSDPGCFFLLFLNLFSVIIKYSRVGWSFYVYIFCMLLITDIFYRMN